MKLRALWLVSGFVLGSSSVCAGAGMTVFDPENYYRNLITSTKNIAMAKTLMDQYKTQLLQYQNMQLNSATPTRTIWQDASATIGQLQSSMDSLNYYKKQLGSLDTYLGKFSDTPGYKNSPCFSGRGCTQAEWQALSASRDLGNASQKRSVDALYRRLDQQHASLQASADNLGHLQTAAKDVRGQLEALSYANQFASQIATELMQIRSLLIAQQSLLASHHQAQTN